MFIEFTLNKLYLDRMDKHKMIGISDSAGIYRKKLLLIRTKLKKDKPDWLDDADVWELDKNSLSGIAKIVIDRFEKLI